MATEKPADTAAPSAHAPARIVSLRADNFKRLRAVDITVAPGTSVVQITGKNGQGKSSVLDAIQAALGGRSAAPAKPVRRGADKAEVEVDLGRVRVRWSCNAKTGNASVTVVGADGAKLASPQSVLDALYTDLTFDPMHFVRLPAKAQGELLRRVGGLEATCAELDAALAKAEENRTEAGRALKTAEAMLAGTPAMAPGPVEEVAADTLLAELEKAGQKKAENNKARLWLASRRHALATAESNAAALAARVENLAAQLRAAQQEHDAAVAEVKSMGDTVREYEPKVAALVDPDTKAITEQLGQIETTNDAVRKRRARANAEAAANAAREAHRKADREVEAVRERKRAALAAATLPVPGLAVDEDGAVLLNGQPFDQASSAEQVRASVAIGLAMNPALRVMLVREGSLLDNDSRQLLAKLAAEYGAQVWVEEVTDGQPVGVVIEDGEVKSGGAA